MREQVADHCACPRNIEVQEQVMPRLLCALMVGPVGVSQDVNEECRLACHVDLAFHRNQIVDDALVIAMAPSRDFRL
jgi:hypothetical protein